MADAEIWKRCSACKESIALGATYWACNVSTCNRKRTALVFCTVSCWEVHLPEANHRESWAVEKTAPRVAEAAGAPAALSSSGTRRIVRTAAPPVGDASKAATPDEILIIASRLKDYVRATSGFNTSDGVLGPLSDAVRRICDDAIENARRDERKTVLERDLPPARR